MYIWNDKIIHCSACSRFGDPFCNITIYEATNEENHIGYNIVYPIYFSMYELDDKFNNNIYNRFVDMENKIGDKYEKLSIVFIWLCNLFTSIFFNPITYIYRLFYLLKNKKIPFVYDVMLDDIAKDEILKYDKRLQINKDDYYNTIDNIFTVDRSALSLYMKIKFVFYGDIKLLVSIDPNNPTNNDIIWYKV